MTDNGRCTAPRDGAPLGGQRCDAPATHNTIYGRHCDRHAEDLRRRLRKPHSFTGRVRSEAEIAEMVRPLPS